MTSLQDHGNGPAADNSYTICPKCGGKIKPGKKEKKFCSDHCQHIYNQRIRRKSYSYAQRINSILLKNRNILHSLLPQDSKKVKISCDVLAKKKFQFDYHTQIVPAKNGGTYVYCYEYGYLLLKNNRFLIVRKTKV